MKKKINLLKNLGLILKWKGLKYDNLVFLYIKKNVLSGNKNIGIKPNILNRVRYKKIFIF